jgi:hypothetical protein
MISEGRWELLDTPRYVLESEGEKEKPLQSGELITC